MKFLLIATLAASLLGVANSEEDKSLFDTAADSAAKKIGEEAGKDLYEFASRFLDKQFSKPQAQVQRPSTAWTPGAKHPQLPNVVAAATPNVWTPAFGYTWLSPDKNDLRVTPSVATRNFSQSGVVSTSNYTGNVGKLAARFTLSWNKDGTVSGQYDYPARQGKIYRLVGNNPAEGFLYLEEFDNGSLSARVYLTKQIEGNSIYWRGVMENTDGRNLPVTLKR